MPCKLFYVKVSRWVFLSGKSLQFPVTGNCSIYLEAYFGFHFLVFVIYVDSGTYIYIYFMLYMHQRALCFRSVVIFYIALREINKSYQQSAITEETECTEQVP